VLLVWIILTQDERTIIPVKFDLAIDSLGQDLTADNLCFTLHLPNDYLDFEMDQVYPPLTIDEVEIANKPGEINICIDRQSANAQKTGMAYERIKSNEPILSGVHCIVVIDIGGEENAIDPISISGYTQISQNEVVSFMPNNLSLGFDTNLLQNGEAMNLTLNVNHENCNVFGSVKIMALGTPPYTFSLINFATNSVNSSPTINSKDYQFNNLEAGEYEIVVFDNTNCEITKKFNVDFVANLDGSYCCPKNLIIPSGINNNFYSASDTISLSMGTLIAKGSLEICD